MENSINSLIHKLEQSKGSIESFRDRKKVEVPFSELFNSVKKAASFLKTLSLNTNSSIGIIGKNSLDWVIIDLACIYCGYKLCPIETEGDVAYLIDKKHELSYIFISDENMEYVNIPVEYQGRKISFGEILSYEEVDKTLEPYTYTNDEVLSYKFTSGSTGNPKIIGNSSIAVSDSIEGVQEIFGHNSKERVLVFLPLNLLQQRYWIYSAILYDFTIIVVPKEYVFFSIMTDRPSVIMGVPYLYIHLKEEFSKKLSKDTSLQEAFQSYTKNSKEQEKFKPFHEFLGSNINYLWTGSAPISKEVIDFYFSMGMPLYQGYGMNETCIIAKNYPDNNKKGSVGKIFPGKEVVFDKSSQILVKSKNPVCCSYTLSEKEDNKLFLENNYVATGDLGYLDEEGYLYINGRIKEMIVLSSSKKIFPSSIEQKVEAFSEIENCVIYGDDRPFLSALIVPTDPKYSYDTIKGVITEYNSGVKDENKIFKFFVCDSKWSEQPQYFSNQNKLRRQSVYKDYKTELEALYN